MLRQWEANSWSSSAAVGEGLDVIPLPYEEKSWTQTGDEEGGMLNIVPGEKRGLS